MFKKKVSDQKIIQLYKQYQSVWKVAEHCDLTGQSIWVRLKKLKIKLKGEKWNKEEIDFLIAYYKQVGEENPLNLNFLAVHFKKLKSNISRKARELHLTNIQRKHSDQHRKHQGDSIRKKWKIHGHPKGMLGKHHAEEIKKRISNQCKITMNYKTPMDWKIRARKIFHTRLQRYGAGLGYGQTQNSYSRCNHGRRKDLNNAYFRSAWEANYARYLNFLVQQKSIQQWKYEAKRFYFEKIRRGTISYLPDFEIINNDGSVEYHEVKGWLTNKGNTAIKRMKRYYPDIKLRVIEERAYKTIQHQVQSLIPNWEK